MIIFYISLSVIILTIITLLYCFCCCIIVVNDGIEYSEVRDEDLIIVNSPFDNILDIDIPSDIDCIEYDRN